MSQPFTSHHTHFTIKSCNILYEMTELHISVPSLEQHSLAEFSGK